jgi:hypothetical protein
MKEEIEGIKATILKLKIMLDNELDYERQRQIIYMINCYKQLLEEQI